MSLPAELQSFTGRLLAVRSKDASLTADVARGITETTERYAYPYVVPATVGLRRKSAVTGATRALAMIAANKRIPNTSAPLGSCFNRIGGNADTIGMRLSLLIDLDIEQAASVIGDLVSRAPAVNFYALVELLTFWESGDADRDTAHRSRLVYDFYARPFKPTSTTQPKAA
jgi:hypothetical protein